jgi:gamma-glutamylputrescine oxidase
MNNAYPPLSYWEKKHFLSHQDVIIIGSGFVGLHAAIYLKAHSPKLYVSIVDAGVMPLGASTRNAGFACFGTPSELEDDLAHMDEEDVFETVRMRYSGLVKLKKNIGPAAMDYRQTGGVEIFGTKEKDNFDRLEAKLHYLNERLADIVGMDACIQVRDNSYGLNMYKHVFYNPLEGQLDPGKLVKSLLAKAVKSGIQLFFNNRIKEILESDTSVELITDQGLHFTAGKCLIATNGFSRRLFPELQVQAARNQVLITKPIAGLDLNACFHYNKGYYYFRNVGHRILLGGARNISLEEEFTDEFGHTEVIQRELLRFLKDQILPGKPFEIDQWWSGIMGVGPSKNCILEWVGRHQFAAVRLGGMGVAIGTHIGEHAAERILQSL